MMTVVTILTICISAIANAKTFSQTIRLNLKSVQLTEVLTAIEKQSDYTFFYKTEDLKGLKNIDVNVNESSISNILQQVLKDLSLTYNIQGKTIAVNKILSAPVKSWVADESMIRQAVFRHC
jgi:type II secretory pathway component GspD/PulD (secretin)